MLAFLLINACFSFGIRTFNLDDYQVIAGEEVESSSFEVRANKDLGFCACDVTDQCDTNCCCDPDCPASVFSNNTFSSCSAESVAASQSQLRSLRLCSDPEYKGEGSLIDWFQRTMLCISRVNNPSPGSYYKVVENRDTQNYVDTESSISSAFTVVENNENTQLEPLLTSLNALENFVITSTELNEIPLTTPNTGICSGNNTILYYNSFGSTCTYDFNFTSPNETGIFKNITCENETNENLSELVYCQLPTEVTVSSAMCSNVTSCTASVSVTRTANTTFNTTLNNHTSVNLYVNFIWETAAQPTFQDAPSRGYLFNEEILDQNYNVIEINAPSSGNMCNESVTGILFGADLDFTCYGGEFINLSNINETSPYFDITSLFPYSFNATSFVQSPIRITNTTDAVRAIKQTPLRFSPEDLNNGNATIMLTDIIRTIDIFYSTVGHTKSPQHILEDFVVSYNYSTAGAQAKSTLYFSNVNNIKYRTVVRFFEYPNSINLNKGATDTDIQAWLPF
ncbi:hypothetical protein TRFO_23663 [Tritrichomonas foetus]|uniref:Tectonic-1-3 N-terminal domain-containing protein n=1 Tax=Tritrichomonas foetus TaxID=1144522 RepID=A0A1J4KEK4_9EUKA|nr:hypothetical protein TRFO_23663 [Tritrichomonas foetus]|eukprot:OHT08030.1 hypothetical protein TRFO_23663 [Tritrichomonas foetus]